VNRLIFRGETTVGEQVIGAKRPGTGTDIAYSALLRFCLKIKTKVLQYHEKLHYTWQWASYTTEINFVEKNLVTLCLYRYRVISLRLPVRPRSFRPGKNNYNFQFFINFSVLFFCSLISNNWPVIIKYYNITSSSC
jgi:hypothetical protein